MQNLIALFANQRAYLKWRTEIMLNQDGEGHSTEDALALRTLRSFV